MKLETVLLLCLFVYLSAAVDLPEFIHVCKRNDPNLEKCISESVEYLKPYLMKGVPEYNIPSLEPLLLKKLVATKGTGLNITAQNIHAYGASNFIVRKLRVDINTLRFAVDILLPHLYIDGLYDVEGRVLLLPIRGSGPMRGNFTECTGSVKLQGVLQKGSDGQDHLKIADFVTKISIGKGSLRLDNLFGGDETLGNIINSAINSNFDAFIKELQPIIESTLSDAFLDIANSIVSPFTHDQLFPLS